MSKVSRISDKPVLGCGSNVVDHIYGVKGQQSQRSGVSKIHYKMGGDIWQGSECHQ